jgi:iron-sulfur cluster repair protein YtfE (RIC family)
LKNMNVIELLKEDHRRVEKLFQKVEATEESEHMKLFEQIKEELEIHAHVEEVVFYPKLKEEGDKELQDITLEGIEEHHQAKIFLREISNLADESEKFEPKLKVLMEDIEHHVQEEEGEMFPMVEEQFDKATLEELGKQVEEEKGRYKRSLAAGSK